MQLYELAGEQGFVEAQVNAAFMYEKGQGSEVNLAKAIAWYEKAASAGGTYAQERLVELKKD